MRSMEEKTRTSKLLPGLGLALSAMVLGLFAGGLVGRLMVSKADGMAGGVWGFAPPPLPGGVVLSFPGGGGGGGRAGGDIPLLFFFVALAVPLFFSHTHVTLLTNEQTKKK